MKPRLLIVDDEPDMLDFLERVFRADYTVVRASSAEEALAELGRAKFSLVITDQKMPHITGVELLERIGERYPSLVKVLLSGFTEVPRSSEPSTAAASTTTWSSRSIPRSCAPPST